MPQAKIKPSDIATEAKRLYIPQAIDTCPQFPASSIAYPDASELKGYGKRNHQKLRVAVIEGDPVDVALEWHDFNCKDTAAGSASRSSIAGSTIPLVNMANEKRAGGDWESGLIAPEECLCRRSTLAHALVTPSSSSPKTTHYPIRTSGGIYSPSVGKRASISLHLMIDRCRYLDFRSFVYPCADCDYISRLSFRYK